MNDSPILIAGGGIGGAAAALAWPSKDVRRGYSNNQEISGRSVPVFSSARMFIRYSKNSD